MTIVVEDDERINEQPILDLQPPNMRQGKYNDTTAYIFNTFLKKSYKT